MSENCPSNLTQTRAISKSENNSLHSEITGENSASNLTQDSAINWSVNTVEMSASNLDKYAQHSGDMYNMYGEKVKPPEDAESSDTNAELEDFMTSDIDAYGFRREPDFDREEYEQFFSRYLSVLARRASRWTDMVTHRQHMARNSKLKRFCRKGIPGEFRASIWLHVSGAENELRAHQGLYASLLKGPHDNVLVQTIKADIPRTFPDNIYFRDVRDPKAKQRPLFNVLLCLATKNPNIGYCQGLNFIAGLLLLAVRDEEQVFWLLDTLLNHVLPPGYHAQDLLGVKAEIQVLEELVRTKLPGVDKALSWCGVPVQSLTTTRTKLPGVDKALCRCGVPLQLVTTKWFICCFADVLSVETVLRLWDCLFYEGVNILHRATLTLVKLYAADLEICSSLTDTVLRLWDCLFYEGVKILHRAALTLVKLYAADLERCSSLTDVVEIFKAMPRHPVAKDCHKFLKLIFEEPGSLPKAKVQKLREQNVEKILADS